MISHNMISQKKRENSHRETQTHSHTFLEFDCELLQGIGFEGDENKVVNIVSNGLYKRVEYIPGSSIFFRIAFVSSTTHHYQQQLQ